MTDKLVERKEYESDKIRGRNRVKDTELFAAASNLIKYEKAGE